MGGEGDGGVGGVMGSAGGCGLALEAYNNRQGTEPKDAA